MSGLSKAMEHPAEADLHQEVLSGVTLAAGHTNHRIRGVIINYLAGEGHRALQLLDCTGPEPWCCLQGGCAAHRHRAMPWGGREPRDWGEVKLKDNTGSKKMGES